MFNLKVLIYCQPSEDTNPNAATSIRTPMLLRRSRESQTTALPQTASRRIRLLLLPIQVYHLHSFLALLLPSNLRIKQSRAYRKCTIHMSLLLQAPHTGPHALTRSNWFLGFPLREDKGPFQLVIEENLSQRKSSCYRWTIILPLCQKSWSLNSVDENYRLSEKNSNW